MPIGVARDASGAANAKRTQLDPGDDVAGDVEVGGDDLGAGFEGEPNRSAGDRWRVAPIRRIAVAEGNYTVIVQ